MDEQVQAQIEAAVKAEAALLARQTGRFSPEEEKGLRDRYVILSRREILVWAAAIIFAIGSTGFSTWQAARASARSIAVREATIVATREAAAEARIAATEITENIVEDTVALTFDSAIEAAKSAARIVGESEGLDAAREAVPDAVDQYLKTDRGQRMIDDLEEYTRNGKVYFDDIKKTWTALTESEAGGKVVDRIETLEARAEVQFATAAIQNDRWEEQKLANHSYWRSEKPFDVMPTDRPLLFDVQRRSVAVLTASGLMQGMEGARSGRILLVFQDGDGKRLGQDQYTRRLSDLYEYGTKYIPFAFSTVCIIEPGSHTVHLASGDDQDTAGWVLRAVDLSAALWPTE